LKQQSINQSFLYNVATIWAIAILVKQEDI